LREKKDRPETGLDEIKRMNSDAMAPTYKRGAGMNDTPTTP